PLLLNPPCQVCAFRQRCHDQAVREENLSLLRGMSEKERKHYSKKGIFTITQLAHTFRPRRKGKRATPPTQRHDHALHALAIRDNRIYVLGTPQLPTCPVQVYLDIESNPDGRCFRAVDMLPSHRRQDIPIGVRGAMITQVLHCPYCHETDIVKHGLSPEGKQRYCCRTCLE